MFLVVLVVFSFGCAMHKEMEVEFTHAELVRIDTLYRYPGQIKQLTWKDDKNTEYISVANMKDVFLIGLKMRVLRRR